MRKIYTLMLLYISCFILLSGCGFNIEPLSKGETSTDSKISINITKNSQDYKNEDGVIMLSYKSCRADVVIENNTTATDAISASLQSSYNALDSQVDDNVASATDWYNTCQSDPSYAWYSNFDISRELTVGRSDTKIVSFIYSDYFYMCGVHGLANIFAVNYDTETGKLLTLPDLTDDKQKLIDYSLTYLLWLAKKPGFADIYPWADEEALKSVIADGLWYFTDSGLDFICNEYTIGPYASGSTIMEIPYTDLDGIIMEKWLPGDLK